MADALGSLAVVVAALVILTTGWRQADPTASLLIGLMIVPRTWKLLREAVDVLLEAAPRDVDMAEVRAHILALPEVEGLHDLHVWTITSGMPILSAHVVVSQDALDSVGHEKLLHDLQGCLGDHFDVAHCTLPVGAPRACRTRGQALPLIAVNATDQAVQPQVATAREAN